MNVDGPVSQGAVRSWSCRRCLPGRYRPACLMTQTGARSVSSPTVSSTTYHQLLSHSLERYAFRSLTSSGSEDQIVLHRSEIGGQFER